jgi:hypothetical protein
VFCVNHLLSSALNSFLFCNVTKKEAQDLPEAGQCADPKDVAMIGRMIPIGGTPRTGRFYTISQSVGVARSGIVMIMTCDVVVLQNQDDPTTDALSRVSAACTTFRTLTFATQGAAASRGGA